MCDIGIGQLKDESNIVVAAVRDCNARGLRDVRSKHIHSRLEVVHLDLGDPVSIRQAAADTSAVLDSGLDYLIHCAGVSFQDLTPFEEVYVVHIIVEGPGTQLTLRSQGSQATPGAASSQRCCPPRINTLLSSAHQARNKQEDHASVVGARVSAERSLPTGILRELLRIEGGFEYVRWSL